jgi:hypothetical protein
MKSRSIFYVNSTIIILLIIGFWGLAFVSTTFAQADNLKFAKGSGNFSYLQPLDPIPVTATTGEKPQSKVWFAHNHWWTVMPCSDGTFLWKLEGITWSRQLYLIDSHGAHADVKAKDNRAYILLFRKSQSYLAVLEYVDSLGTYQFWSQNPAPLPLSLDSYVETATIDIDTQQRMWLASDAYTDINIRWSDPPYTTWNGPFTIAEEVSAEVNSDDICAVVAFDGKIGVFWSDQNDERFGFRYHEDGESPTDWSGNERPASQSAHSVGGGMADDHMNIAVGPDGTLYVAVKTSYDTQGYPKIALLVRRTDGDWDDLYEVDERGTRPIAILDEANDKLTVVYTETTGYDDIVCRHTSLNSISFGSKQTLIPGTHNNATSTKERFQEQVLILSTSGDSQLDGVLCSREPIPECYANLRIQLQGAYDAAGDSMRTTLQQRDGLPQAQPFNCAPWNYLGSESVSSVPEGVVDWVLVELRRDTSAASRVARRAAFLRKDGAIVDVETGGQVHFPAVAEDDYYVVVYHRNHLPVMSSNAIHLDDESSSLYDFTIAMNHAYQRTGNPMVELENGVFGLIAGDANSDGVVDTDDRTQVWISQNGTSWSYNKSGDLNLDGAIDAIDYNRYWLPNRTATSQVP